eukprot:TRINITY_DN56344_c0_g1_i1.p1 TRINITY_DN56344_c0_g1~~TRINITY_DN56344_c0_g1_i1.p1  ORF type:complete len:970 (-),score=192.33 TRINITY_DN56344_c0_g1_i1:7-2916(-)
MASVAPAMQIRSHACVLQAFAAVLWTAVFQAVADCEVDVIDVKKLKKSSDTVFEEATSPKRLTGITEKWTVVNWSQTELLAQFGNIKVWPRSLHGMDNLIASQTGKSKRSGKRSAPPPNIILTSPRTVRSTFREYLEEDPNASLVGQKTTVAEIQFCDLVRALSPLCPVPKQLQKTLFASPTVALATAGAGAGFHKADSQNMFAGWVAQIHGRTEWALLPPDESPKAMWPWSNATKPSKKLVRCTLERGDALFIPRGWYRAFQAEDSVNLLYGWQGSPVFMKDMAGALGAITLGDADAMAKAMEKLPQDSRSQEVAACVNHAVQTGHVAVLKRLVRMGIELDKDNPFGSTHLHVAASAGQRDSVEYLLQQGADPSVRTAKDGSTPLNYGAHGGHVDVVEAILKKSPKRVKDKDDTGLSALHAAAGSGQTAAIRTLLAQKASLSASDKQGHRPLDAATSKNQLAAMQLLLDARAKMDSRNKDGDTALHRAVIQGHAEAAQLLLRSRANIEAERKGGQTPVHAAAYLGHVELLEVLKQHGANLRPDEEKRGYSPESLAASGNHMDVAEWLRKNGKYSTSTMDSAAFAAVKAGHLPQLKNVLKNRLQIGPPEAETEFKLVLAHSAIPPGHAALVEYLANESHVFDKADKQDQRRLDGHHLVATPEKKNSLVLTAVQHGHGKIVKLLADNGVDVDMEDKNGTVPLLHAASMGHAEVTKALLANGANIHKADKETGFSAIHAAVSSGHATALEVLLEHGASPHLPAAERQHIHVAAAAGHRAVAELLLRHSADVASKDIVGVVPMLMAAREGHVGMMEFLTKMGADTNYQVDIPVPETTGSASGGNTTSVTWSALNLAAAKGHAPVLAWLTQGSGTEQLQIFADKLEKGHGHNWRKEFEKASNLDKRIKSDEVMRETLADPEKKRRLQEFNERYAKMAPHERHAIDRQLAHQLEQEEAKTRHEGKRQQKLQAEL